MIPLADVAQVVAADKAAQASGTPEAVLMGRAGHALAVTARELLATTAGARVVALAGKGHNGGDALECLARLARRGAGVEALLTADEDTLDAEGARCVAAVRRAGGRVERFTPERAARVLGRADLIVDGLLGTGSSGAPRGEIAAAIEAANIAGAPVLAVDIPSGVDGTTGEVPAAAIHARATVTFQAAKPGHVLTPGSTRTGTLVVAGIGLPLETRWGISTADELAPLVPVPEGELHKRSRGVLLVVAGSSGMAGAPTLTGRAARRAGTGLLILAVPGSAAERVGAAVPEAITVALPEADGGITTDAVRALERWLGEAGALAIGPGLGRSEGTQAAVRALVTARPDLKVVTDADGLFALAGGDGVEAALRGRTAPTLLTPHAGEFSRLAPGADGTRIQQAAAAAARWGATVLLKGGDTVIAEPGDPAQGDPRLGGRLVVNRTGTAVLATGGTGDVLTGITGSLAAQGLDAFDAARLGAFVHGRAGQLATRDLGPVSVAAGDIPDHLPAAFTEVLTGTAPAGAHRLPA